MDSSLLIPLAIGLIVVVVLLKIAIAIEHAIMKLAMLALLVLVVVGALGGGANLYGRINAIQSAAASAARGISPGATSPEALQRSLNAALARTLSEQGLNPAYLRVHVVCAGSQPQLQVQYTDTHFMMGLLGGHTFTVALPDGVRC